MAAFFNLTGAYCGAVAATIGKGLVDTDVGHHDDRALCCASRRSAGTLRRGGWACHQVQVTH